MKNVRTLLIKKDLQLYLYKTVHNPTERNMDLFGEGIIPYYYHSCFTYGYNCRLLLTVWKLNNILKFNSYLTENISRSQYKDHLFTLFREIIVV
jgi:hypothetical protein